MNIFDIRTFNADELNSLKIILEDTIESLKEVDVLQEHIKDNTQGVCIKLNDGIDDKDQQIKPGLIVKMAKAIIKSNLDDQKASVSEVEDGIKIIMKEF